MSVNKMINLYVTYGLDEETWEMLYRMTCHNLISSENWAKFQETCKGYQFSDGDGTKIIDTCNNDKVVYVTDESGYWVKVK